MAKPSKDQDELPKEEAGRRRDELARRILKTPPQRREPSGKGKPSPEKTPGGKRSSPASEMLTDSEVESLRREAKETSAYARKAFADLRPKA